MTYHLAQCSVKQFRLDIAACAIQHGHFLQMKLFFFAGDRISFWCDNRTAKMLFDFRSLRSVR